MRGVGGCKTATGELDTSHFGKPVVAVGIYISLASLSCGLLMLADIISGLRRHKPWLPCNYFPLNAVTLTILGVAVKIPTDINNPMPGPLDQLSKLTGTALVCTYMAFVLPSLGPMDGAQLFSNVSALVILVITIIVDVSIQITTGVIYTFITDHIVTLICMSAILMYTVSTALAVPGAKLELEKQFQLKKTLFSSSSTQLSASAEDVKVIKKKTEDYWIMAHFGSPQYVVGRLRTFTIISFVYFCAVFISILVRIKSSSLFSSSPMYCKGNSDYRWTTRFIVSTQLLDILLGSASLVCRACHAKFPLRNLNWGDREVVEEYRVYQLRKFKNLFSTCSYGPLKIKQIWHWSVLLLLSASILTQKVLVLVQKISDTLFGFTIDACYRLFLCRFHVRDINWRDVDPLPGLVSQLENEKISSGLLRTYLARRITEIREISRKNSPALLMSELLIHRSSRNGYRGLAEFVNQGELVSDCWTLPVVTLSTIAVALYINDTEYRERLELLLKAVDQGLKYMRFVEEKLDKRGRDYKKGRDDVELVWHGLGQNKWFGVSLKGMNNRSNSGNDQSDHCIVIEKLLTESFRLMQPPYVAVTPAEGCMFEVGKNIQKDFMRALQNKTMFPLLQRSIADIMAACLTNLPTAVEEECSSRNIASTEERINYALSLLYETEGYLPGIMLPQQSMDSVMQQPVILREYFYEWIRLYKNREVTEVKIRLTDNDAYILARNLLSSENVLRHERHTRMIYDGDRNELSTRQIILELRNVKYSSVIINSSGSWFLSLNTKPHLSDGISRTHEDKEKVDLSLADTKKPWSLVPYRVIRRVKEEFCVDPGQLKQHLGKIESKKIHRKLGGVEEVIMLEETNYHFDDPGLGSVTSYVDDPGPSSTSKHLGDPTPTSATTYEINCRTDEPERVKGLLEAFLRSNNIPYSYPNVSEYDILLAGELLPSSSPRRSTPHLEEGV